MPNPRLVGIRAAEKTSAGLRALFDRMGTRGHPRGWIASAYRAGRWALADVLRSPTPGPTHRLDVQDVLFMMRRSLYMESGAALQAAVQLGQAQAAAELDAWGLDPVPSAETINLAAAQAAWLAVFDAQATAVEALDALGADEALILGDEERAGLLSSTALLVAGAAYLALAAVLGWENAVRGAVTIQPVAKDEPWYKQAVAAIDPRTTDCCLRAHAQVVPFDADFRLDGYPRFADHLPWTPFHSWCRSVCVLVPRSEIEDPLTREMREVADLELGERERVHARSRFRAS